MLTIGTVLNIRQKRKQKNERKLLENGVRIVAQISGYEVANIRINKQYLSHLCCSYTASNGTTYLFKSGILRVDPTPYLPDSHIIVYQDLNDISRYFVDVDGSVGMDSHLVE